MADTEQPIVYAILLGAVALVSIICAMVLLLVDGREADLVPISTIGGVAVGALVAMARKGRSHE